MGAGPAVHRLTLLVALVVSLTRAPAAMAAEETLEVYGENVTVYSGPGRVYRPLLRLEQDATVEADEEIVENERGRFYKVFVKKGDETAEGYIPVSAKVRRKGTGEFELSAEMQSFNDYAFARSSVQISHALFKTERSMATCGLLRYVGPGFYYKPFAGAFMAPSEREQTGSAVGGLELGSVSPLSRNWSGVISLAGGVFFSPKENALFTGNRGGFSNFLAHTTFGVRYNSTNRVSVGMAGTQAALFSANNSLVTWGVLVNAEFGI